jgi:spermidine synthase
MAGAASVILAVFPGRGFQRMSADIVVLKSASGFAGLRAQASGQGAFTREDDDYLCLYFDSSTVQSKMRRDNPAELALGYTRAMMAFLLFVPQPRNIAMIGLGGGSMPKYCYARLPDAAIVVAEIDAEVIALRDQFLVPADDARFQVLQMDGAEFVRGPASTQRGPFDAIVVDGFDARGQPAQLCSLDFYASAYARLAPGGVVAVNLHHNEFYSVALERLRQVFDRALVVVDCETSANRIAFGYKGDLAEVFDRELTARVRELSPRHPVDLCRTARRLKREWLNDWLDRYVNRGEAALT